MFLAIEKLFNWSLGAFGVSPMKICDLTQFYSPVSGGVKRYLQEKVRYLREHTADSHLLIVPGERDERIEEDRATVYTIRSPVLSRTSRYRALLRLGEVERILALERPDIIESGDPYQVAWKAVASGRALGIPVVAFYHSHFPEAYLRSAAKFFGATVTEFAMDAAQRYVRSLYSRFERTMVPSPALGRVLLDWGVANVENIDLGVDAEVFCPGPEDAANTRSDMGVPTDRLLILYVGRLAAEKNTKTLFDAFSLLHRERPGRVQLMVVGDGQQRSLVNALTLETGAVTWLPYCAEPERLAKIYRSADLFVHPGVQETFGLVTLESQACGTPVVGIRGSYMDRIIYSDQRHWADENTAESLAEAVRRTCAGDLVGAGTKASRAVRSRYCWKFVFDHLFGIYRDVIANYNAGNV